MGTWLHRLAFAALAAVAVGAFALWQLSPASNARPIEPTATSSPRATPRPERTATPSPITVYVSGAVARPGLYQLASQARVDDALRAAGGLGEDADTQALNLAARLQDGQRVHVPRLGEPTPTATAGGQRAGRATSTPTPTLEAVININTATAELLDRLPGIGPTIASNIVAYREAYGPFRGVDDLVRFKLLNQTTFTRLRDRLTV